MKLKLLRGKRQRRKCGPGVMLAKQRVNSFERPVYHTMESACNDLTCWNVKSPFGQQFTPLI